MRRLLQVHYTSHTSNKQVRELMLKYTGEHDHPANHSEMQTVNLVWSCDQMEGAALQTPCYREAQMAVEREEDL